ncbi:MAG: DUF1653 domain-containing protein [Acholeplasmatales bacterium]|nr:DUF1653 domain-containing protein [Acholeplasmatales bacterium]
MIKLGIYKHYKGNIYEAIGIASHSETLEKMVVYRSVKNQDIWVRPIYMWDEDVKLSDGSIVKRFQYIGDKNAE